MQLRYLFVLLFWFSIALPVEAGIGTITLAEGEVRLIRGSELFRGEVGVALEQEDIVESSEDSRAQLEMVDGTILDVGAASTLHLVRYRLNEAQQVEESEVSLLKGWLRFVTGLIQRDREVNYTTPVVTLGIKGTQGVIAVNGDDYDATLEEGVVEVRLLDGEGATIQREALRVGQHFEYRGGNRGRLHQRIQQRFQQRFPHHYRKVVQRRLQQLKRQGLLPKRLRSASYDDIKHLLKISPKLRREMSKRFARRLEDPVFRRAVQRNLARHPEWRERIKVHNWKRRNAGKRKRDRQK